MFGVVQMKNKINHLKKFFKPNLFKITLSIIILIVLEFLSYKLAFVYYSQFVYCMAIGCPTPNTETYKIMVSLFIPLVLVSYFLSCLLTFICKKKIN